MSSTIFALAVLLVGGNFFTSAFLSWNVIDVSKAVKFYNSLPKTTWKASANGFSGQLHPSAFKSRLGLLRGVKLQRSDTTSDSNESSSESEEYDLPSEYDARTAYPNSSTISSIKDQSNCGSCWAVSVASSFSDRLYTFSGGKLDYNMSAEQLMACSTENHGCEGGYLDEAWKYIEKNGLGTGGDYGSNEGCQPYSIPPTKGKNSGRAKTPACSNTTCPITFKATNTREVPSDEREIRKEIYENGPVSAAFLVYLSFMFYHEGIYFSFLIDLALGWHAVRIVGWAEEGGIPYWIVANSWGRDWGERGTFRILRGFNTCFMESNVFVGIPIA